MNIKHPYTLSHKIRILNKKKFYSGILLTQIKEKFSYFKKI